jgi:hypothetical protein
MPKKVPAAIESDQNLAVTQPSRRSAEQIKRAVEIGETILKDVFRIALKAPEEIKLAALSGSMFALGTAAWQLFGYERYRRLLESVAKQDASTEAQVAWRVASSFRHKWMRDNLHRSMQALREALDRDAEPCLVALFAEYEHRKSTPDGSYQQVASFLVACNGRMLSSARYVLDALPTSQEVDVVGHALRRVSDHNGPITWSPVGRSEGKDKMMLSTPIAPPPDYEDLFAMLQQFRFGYTANLMNGPAVRVDLDRDRAVRLLHKCLERGSVLAWRPDGRSTAAGQTGD